MSQRGIEDILKRSRTIAVVGMSRDPSKDSHSVGAYLKNHGFTIIPINPFADEILGERCYKSLLEVPENVQRTIDVVDVFRPSEDVPPIVDEAIMLRKKRRKPDVVWMQLGIVNQDAAKKAKAVGLKVIMDRCMRTEHRVLLQT